MSSIETALKSREAILSRIRAERPAGDPLPRPPVPRVWPQTNPTTEQLIEQFTESLEAVDGEVIRCRSIDRAKEALAELVQREQWDLVGAVEEPVCREVVAGLKAEVVAWADDRTEPRRMAEFSAGMIASKHLLADTGSCMIDCPTAERRLMCYIPPVCLIVARIDQLAENLPAAWKQIAAAAAETKLGGEYVFITGPSRTADIEKVMILGVHGPRRVVVLLIEA
jgi:L-lactate dehydrogenase complex protein LldG